MPKVYPKPRSIRAQAFEESNYPTEVEGLRCVEVMIPDSVEFMAQLAGLVALATKQFNYQNKDTAHAAAVTALWRDAYLATDWEGCMTCEDVADCIEESEDVQAAITNLINNYNNSTQGYPLTPQQMSASLTNQVSGCDLDVLWGSCLNAVVTLNRLNEDFLETMEALTDNQEMLAFVVGAIPILETLPIDEFIEIADRIRGFVQATYAAGYDLDFETQMACEIFCLAKANDCTLDMQVLVDYYWHAAELFPGFDDAFTAAITIVEAMANWEEMTGEAVVICMMACNVGFLTFLNSALGMDFGDFKLKAKAGIPDDDWQTCEACPEEWVHVIDFTASDGDFDAVDTFAVWETGVGWKVNAAVTTNSIVIQRALPAGNYTTIRFEATEAPAHVSAVSLRTALFPSGSVIEIQSNSPGTAITTLLVDEDNPAVVFVNYSKTASNPTSGYTGVLTSVTFRGIGTNPFI